MTYKEIKELIDKMPEEALDWEVKSTIIITGKKNIAKDGVISGIIFGEFPKFVVETDYEY